MPRRSHSYAVDARLIHRESGEAALTAATVFPSHEQRAQTRTEYVTVIRVEGITATDEEYRFVMEGSNDGFATVEALDILSIGAASARIGSDVDTEVGDEYECMWCTEVNGVHYKDWRINMTVAGAAPSIAFSMNTTR